MKKPIEAAALTLIVGTLYPSPFGEPCARVCTTLGEGAERRELKGF